MLTVWVPYVCSPFGFRVLNGNIKLVLISSRVSFVPSSGEGNSVLLQREHIIRKL